MTHDILDSRNKSKMSLMIAYAPRWNVLISNTQQIPSNNQSRMTTIANHTNHCMWHRQSHTAPSYISISQIYEALVLTQSTSPYALSSLGSSAYPPLLPRTCVTSVWHHFTQDNRPFLLSHPRLLSDKRQWA